MPGELSRLRWWGCLLADFDFVGDPAGRSLLSSFHGREVVLRLFPDAFVLPVPPARQDVGEEIADGLAACQVQAARGDDGVAGGVVAGDADGHREGDPVGVDAGLLRGFGFQSA
jgi:hypothetical protein